MNFSIVLHKNYSIYIDQNKCQKANPFSHNLK